MMSLVMRKQMYTVGGYMLNKIMIKIYVKIRYLWYYITHPKMFYKYYSWKMSTKSIDQDTAEITDLYIKKMIEEEVKNGR